MDECDMKNKKKKRVIFNFCDFFFEKIELSVVGYSKVIKEQNQTIYHIR